MSDIVFGRVDLYKFLVDMAVEDLRHLLSIHLYVYDSKRLIRHIQYNHQEDSFDISLVRTDYCMCLMDTAVLHHLDNSDLYHNGNILQNQYCNTDQESRSFLLEAIAYESRIRTNKHLIKEAACFFAARRLVR